MHGYIMLRGIKHEMDLTKKFLETTMLKWNTVDNLTNEEKANDVQFALRPIELFECVFPDTALPQFMKMLNIQPGDEYGSLSFKIQMGILRKMFGAKEFPKLDLTKISAPFIPRRGVSVHAIGLKEDDKRIVDGNSYQEAL